MTWLLVALALVGGGPALAQSVGFETDPEAPTATDLGLSRYVAVLFSAEDYGPDSGIIDLVTPNEDVRRIGELLQDQYGFDVEVVTDATRADIFAHLERLRRELGEDDALLIYYAGHGEYDDATRKGYWLPSNARVDNRAEWVKTDDVADLVRPMAARHVLLVADSCFSGSLTRAIELVATPRAPGQAEAERLARNRSRWVITSGGVEPVTDGGEDGMSAFAYVLYDELEDAEDRYIVPDRLFPRVRERVTAAAGQVPTQGPLVGLNDDHGQMVLANRLSCVRAVREGGEAWEVASERAATLRSPTRRAQVVQRWLRTWAEPAACGFQTPEGLHDVVKDAHQRLAAWAPEGGVAAKPASAVPTPTGAQGWSRPVAWASVGAIAVGTGLLAGTNAWWSARRPQFGLTDDAVIAPDAQGAQQFRTMRALNLTSGVLIGAGAIGWGTAVGVRLTDGGGVVVLRGTL